MLKLDEENILALTISNHSIGDIRLGDSMSSIQSIWSLFHYKGKVKTEFIAPFFLKIYVLDSLIININLLEGKVCQLSVLNEYKGKLNGKIGIGSLLKILKKDYPDLEYEENENFFYSSSLGSVAFF